MMGKETWRLDMLEYIIKEMLKLKTDWRHTNNGKKLLKDHKKLRRRLRNCLRNNIPYIE